MPRTIADERTFKIRCHTITYMRDGALTKRDSILTLDADGTLLPLKGRYTNRPEAIAAVARLLWLDVGKGLPWTPSAIDRVTLTREHDTIWYERAQTTLQPSVNATTP